MVCMSTECFVFRRVHYDWQNSVNGGGIRVLRGRVCVCVRMCVCGWVGVHVNSYADVCSPAHVSERGLGSWAMVTRVEIQMGSFNNYSLNFINTSTVISVMLLKAQNKHRSTGLTSNQNTLVSYRFNFNGYK